MYGFVGNDGVNKWDYLGWKTVRGRQSDGIFSWNYAFDATFDKKNCLLQLTVNIELNGLDINNEQHLGWVANLSNRIKKDFKGKKIIPDNPDDPKCCCKQIAIGFYVNFTNGTRTRPHHRVNLDVTGARSNMRNWYTSDPGVWLHEVMHMFGLKDEYLDPIGYPNKTEENLPADSRDGIMRNSDKPVLDRHIDEIVKRASLRGLKGCAVSTKSNQ